MNTSAGTSYSHRNPNCCAGTKPKRGQDQSVAEHDDALHASSAAAGESLADQDTPDALLLEAGRNRHWRQADQRRLVEVLDGHRGEQDVPDDCCADLRDERDDDCVRAVQGFDDVGFLTPAKRMFVERADDVPGRQAAQSG